MVGDAGAAVTRAHAGFCLLASATRTRYVWDCLGACWRKTCSPVAGKVAQTSICLFFAWLSALHGLQSLFSLIKLTIWILFLVLPSPSGAHKNDTMFVTVRCLFSWLSEFGTRLPINFALLNAGVRAVMFKQLLAVFVLFMQVCNAAAQEIPSLPNIFADKFKLDC